MTSESPDNDDGLTNAEKYQQTQAQLEKIEQEVKATQPLTSEQLDIATLKELYPADEPASKYFLLGINALDKRYEKIRKTRGDGNCYYRSFLYNLCEAICGNQSELERVIKFGAYGTVRSFGGFGAQQCTTLIFIAWSGSYILTVLATLFSCYHSQRIQPIRHLCRRIRGNGN